MHGNLVLLLLLLLLSFISRDAVCQIEEDEYFDDVHEEERPRPPPPPTKSDFDFDLHLDGSNPRKLGLRLSPDLKVISFELNSDGSYPWTYDPGGVREGDELVFIDEVSCKGTKLLQATKAIKMAKVLTFRPREKEHREVLNAQSPLQLKETHVETIMGHMDLLDGHLDLFSVPVTIALFSSLVQEECASQHIYLAEPPSLCVLPTPLPPTLKKFEGSVVLARRGDCSYSAKATNALLLGARALVVSNSDNNRVEMPMDPLYLKSRIGIPAVMISSTDGKKIESSIMAHHSRISARLAISSLCLKADAAFHRKHDETFEKEQREQSARERAIIAESASQVSFKGIRRTQDATTQDAETAATTTKSNRWALQKEKRRASRDKNAKLNGKEEVDPFAWQYSRPKVAKAMFGGELVLNDETIKAEFLAVTDVAEWISSGADLGVVVVARESGCSPKKEVPKATTPRMKAKVRKIVEEATGDFAVIFPTGGCTVAEQILGAEELGAMAVILWRSASASSVDAAVLQDIKGAEELLEDDSPVLGLIISEASAEKVVEAWEGKLAVVGEAAPPTRLSGKVLINNAVSDDWNDISNLLRSAEWPRDQAYRRRLFIRLSKHYDEKRWPDRYRVLKWAFEAAERYWTEEEATQIAEAREQEKSVPVESESTGQRREAFRNDEL